MSDKKVIPFRNIKDKPNDALQKIVDSGRVKKFVIVFMDKDGSAVFENCQFGQRDLAWASVILAKHAVEVCSDVEVT